MADIPAGDFSENAATRKAGARANRPLMQCRKSTDKTGIESAATVVDMIVFLCGLSVRLRKVNRDDLYAGNADRYRLLREGKSMSVT